MLPSPTPHAQDGSFERRVASERAGQRASWLAALARVGVGAWVGALLVAVVPVPFARVGDAGLALLLALPFILCAALLMELGRALVVGTRPWRALSGSLGGAVLQVQLIVAGAVLLIGVYASNVFLVDLPLGRLTTRAYLATAALALLLALATRRLTSLPVLRGRLERVPRWSAAAATLFVFGGAGVFADAVILPGGVPRLHRIALVLVVVSFTAVGALCARRLRLRSVAAAASVATSVLMAAWAIADRPATRLAVHAPPTVHTLLLQEARGLLDRDGDGYSALLAGGDCDDADPRAYPLSRVGRDCLGWLGSGAPVPPRAPLVAPAVSAGPGIIVMVTIDAFRCGFGQDGTGAFRDICPQLTALAAQGRIRLDAHTDGTNTESAMQALHLGGELPQDPPLATLLSRSGYRTHGILTHRILSRNRAIPASFDTIDTSLVPAAARLDGSTATATTDRALAWLQAAHRTPGKLFLWAHYYDPHDPYVAAPGSVLVLDRFDNYSAEVRRTDAEVGRLAQGLSRLARAGEVLLLVLADHGEAFGEHGRDHHFTSVHEESARIPFLAWSPGPDPARHVTAPLPTSVLDVRAFLMAELAGTAYEPSAEVVVETPYLEDPQVGLIAGGWKLIHHLRLAYDELYEIASDPFERDDRAFREPGKVQEMGRKLGARLADRAAR